MPSDSRTLLLRRANLLLSDLGKGVLRLDDALKQVENEFVRDAAIQRFEFAFELGWKAIQAVGRLEGQDCASPRTAFSVAWRNRWIGEEPAWLNMLDDRNRTSHTYREEMAKEVFANLRGHLDQLGSLHQTLVNRVREIEMASLQSPGEPSV